MKPQVVVQRVIDATVLEGISQRTPTVLGHQLEDLLRAATVSVASAVVATLVVMAILVMEAAAAGAPRTELEGEQGAEAITEAEATRTGTSLVSHAATTMPTAELKK
jgi:hypothetical protein